MKWKFSFRRQCCSVVCSFAALVGVLPLYAEVQPAQVRILKVHGAASYSVNGIWKPLSSKLVLTNGAEIKTEANATVDFVLDSSRTSLRLAPKSSLVLETLTREPGLEAVITETSLRLTSGSLVGSQRKLAAPSYFKIKTAKSMASIVGTEYVVTADGSVTCLNGSIEVRYNLPSNGGSVVVNVAAGFTFDAATQKVVATTPAYLNNVIADVNTAKENAQTFQAGGATLVVKPYASLTPAKGNNGVGNGVDPQPPGNPPVNDGPGTGPGNPGNQQPP
jgi:hypothetical protein